MKTILFCLIAMSACAFGSPPCQDYACDTDATVPPIVLTPTPPVDAGVDTTQPPPK